MVSISNSHTYIYTNRLWSVLIYELLYALYTIVIVANSHKCKNNYEKTPIEATYQHIKCIITKHRVFHWFACVCTNKCISELTAWSSSQTVLRIHSCGHTNIRLFVQRQKLSGLTPSEHIHESCVWPVLQYLYLTGID